MRTIVAAAALGVALIGVAAPAQAQSAGNRVHTDIPPEALRPALRSLAQEFGFQIVYPSKEVAALRTRGVSGSFTLAEALAHALAGTGLTFRYIDVHTITILPIAAAVRDPPAGSPRRLGRKKDRPQATRGGTGDGRSGNSLVQRAAPPGGAGNTASDSAAAGSGAAALQEVVVTGTLIRGSNIQSALPMQVLGQAYIARTGATSVPELLQNVSATTSAGTTVTAQATGFLTGGISTVSLHGLGSSRTLVLINGLRSTVYGGGSAGVADNSVDIGSIPVAAIQRVEILEDGASAVYGSDAIAGVVNFILKSDYQGVDASATVGTPTAAGGGTEESASLYAGYGSLEKDRYNIGIGLTFDHMTPIMGASRAYATRYSPGYGNDVTSGFAFPANVRIPPNAVLPNGGVANPKAGSCAPTSINDTNFPAQCRFDNSSYDSLQPEQKKYSVYVNGGFMLTPSTQLFGNALFSQVKTTTFVQPVPIDYQFPLPPGNPYNAYLANLLATQYPGYTAVKPGEAAVLLPPTSPYYPTAFAAANGIAGQPLNLIYRDFADGVRRSQDTANTARVVGGIKGQAAGWSYNASLLFSQVAVYEDLQSGFPQYSKFLPLFASGVINPFGPTPQSVLSQVKAAEFTGQDFSSKTSLTSVGASASRKLATLPAGPLRVAVGTELSRNTFEYSPSGAFASGDIGGFGGALVREYATRSVESVYLELDGYILRSLEADVAVRYDHYQRVGSTVRPQFVLRWQPMSWIQLHGSVGTGFRAPSLTDLYAPQTVGVTSNGTRDPVKCPVFDPNNSACSFQFQTLNGGNPNLKPEKSYQFNLGAVLRPVRNMRLDLNSFWIYLRNEIVEGGLPYTYILQNAQTAAQYSSFITRDASGNIVSISQVNSNLFKTYLSGLDLNFSYDLPLGPGDILVRGNGSFYYKFQNQNANGTWSSELDQGLTPQTEGGGVILRWRHSVTVGYATPSWELSVTQTYQIPYGDIPSTITRVPRRVSAYDRFNVQASYLGLSHFDFTLGMKNIFNRVPPYANYASEANNFVGGYDLSYGDPRDRYIYATIRYHLR